MKKITRTIITGYKYDVVEKNGTTMAIIGQIVNEVSVRSTKESNKIIAENGYPENCILVPNGVEQMVYEMPQDVFIQHATVVSEA
jgi:hypothetical protein